MEVKEKSRRGRRALPKAEKKKKIVVFVKAKAHAKAAAEIKRLAGEYNSAQGQGGL